MERSSFIGVSELRDYESYFKELYESSLELKIWAIIYGGHYLFLYITV